MVHARFLGNAFQLAYKTLRQFVSLRAGLCDANLELLLRLAMRKFSKRLWHSAKFLRQREELELTGKPDVKEMMQERRGSFLMQGLTAPACAG